MASLINRKPAVSGRFYPSDANKLSNDLNDYFNSVTRKSNIGHVNAIISPHAGYVFSGKVAASAFAQINKETCYKNVFILAPSHQMAYNGASVYNIGNYETPLGEIEVNIELANQLIEQNHCFSFFYDAHTLEHSLEVQLPFVQHWLKPGYKIVPIVIGTQDLLELRKLSDALLPYFNNDNLFVVSSDFSHFPNYTDAKKADMLMAEAILTKNVKNVEKAAFKNKKSKIKNLATSACGISGIYCLLYLLQANESLEIDQILYQNSGDSNYGDLDRVVGYLSFVVHVNKNSEIDVKLSSEQQKVLLNIGRNAITSKLKHEDYSLNENEIDNELHNCYGVFVSLHKKGKLRGCIGRFESNEPLYNLVGIMAKAAAFNDTRFDPVGIEELNELEIEISVLSPLKEIKDKNEIKLGKHGIFIKQGIQRGTLLPQVATNNNWTVDEFLGYCSKNKAGIGWDGWKTAQLFIYSATVFSE